MQGQDLSKLPSNTVIERLQTLVAHERKITAEVIDHVKEVDRRRIYLDLGYTSLFACSLRAAKTKRRADFQSGSQRQARDADSYRSARTQRLPYQRDQFCQWVDPSTGRKCGTRFQLQLDHVVSRWAGGTDEIENLQLLRSAHNRVKYRREAGISWQ